MIHFLHEVPKSRVPQGYELRHAQCCPCSTLQTKFAGQRAKGQGQRSNRPRQRLHESKTMESAGSASFYIEHAIADFCAPVHQGTALTEHGRSVIGKNDFDPTPLGFADHPQ